jgi:hypothetical protein
MALLKRFIPFLLTFALGLFVASFFVSLSAPHFNMERRHRCGEAYYLRMENQRLQDENNSLKNQRDFRNSTVDNDFDVALPPALPSHISVPKHLK